MLDIQIYYEMMGEVTDNLKNEIKELTFKVQKAREDENWKTYKNLILAYKEVIQLYKGIVDKISENTTIDNPTKYINNEMIIGLDENTSGLITEAVECIFANGSSLVSLEPVKESKKNDIYRTR